VGKCVAVIAAFSALLAVGFSAAGAAPWPNPNQSMALDQILDVQKTLTRCIIIPRPQHILLSGEELSLMPDDDGQVTMTCKREPSDVLSPVAVLGYACERLSDGTVILREADAPATRSIVFTQTARSTEGSPLGAYSIHMKRSPEGFTVSVEAPEPVGLLYGAYTLIQLMKVEDGKLKLRLARVDDRPAIPLRGPRSVGHSPEWVDWMSFYKMNYASAAFDWRKPIPEDFAERNKYCQARGVLMLPETHAGNVHFSDPAHHEALKQRARELIEAGFSGLYIAVDDFPNELEQEDDRAEYGDGLVGLGKAQMELMREVWGVTRGKMDLFFCPRVYYDPERKSIYPTEATDEEVEYRRLVGELPRDIRIWTTQPRTEYLRLLLDVWKRKPEIYHNFYYSGLADWKLWFEAYPVPSPEMVRSVQSVVAAGSGGPWAREWRVNYLTFAGNVWSPERPIGLKEAFIREYGERAAPVLTRYAELSGGHAVPGHTIMADVWDQPDQYACVLISLGFAGRLWRREATPENVADLQRLAERCARVEALDWDGTGLDEKTVNRFRLNAERIRLNFEIQAALLQAKIAQTMKKQTGQRGRDVAGTLERARAVLEKARVKAQRVREIISAQIPQGLIKRCADYELAAKVDAALTTLGAR